MMAEITTSKRKLKLSGFFACLLLLSASCKKMIEVEAPFTSINSGTVFTTDATTAAVLTGIYANISKANFDNGIISLSFFPSLSADELTLFNPPANVSTYRAFYSNSLVSNTTAAHFWNYFYPVIYITNSVIEGVSASSTLTPQVKKQALGEAKFIRAFCYFYLVNLYGDVPLATGTDYEVNRLLARSSKDIVYQQIITDLKQAQELLSENYINGTLISASSERTSPNKWAATALLARIYMYMENWADAEEQASAVISHTTLYDTVSLNNVFKKNNREAIWQLQPVLTGNRANTTEGFTFVLKPTGPTNLFPRPVYLSSDVVNSFEPGDKRRSDWVNQVTVGAITYHYPYKYKIGDSLVAVQEYSTVLRLGEQYLIRAEARARQGKITEGSSDLNLIRTRAGLHNTTGLNQNTLLDAIFRERRVELFTEWGHRWLDMKRTGAINTIMPSVCTQKGGTWNSNWALYPIPQSELLYNPNLTNNQNPGY